MSAPDLLNISDIAALFRVARRTVADKWLARPDFPRPKLAPTRRTRGVGFPLVRLGLRVVRSKRTLLHMATACRVA